MIEITFFRKELNQKIAFLHKNQTLAEKLGMFNISQLELFQSAL